MNRLFCPQYTIPALTLVLVLNMASVQQPFVGVLAGLLYVAYLGSRLGSILFPEADSYIRTSLGSLAFAVGIIIMGTLFFYVWHLGEQPLMLMTILMPVIVWLAGKTQQKQRDKRTTEQMNRRTEEQKRAFFNKKNIHLYNWLQVAGYTILVCWAFILLFLSQTSDAIRSPWEVVPSYFFVIYFFATLLLCFFLFTSKSNNRSARYIAYVLLSVHLFLTYSVTAFIYQLNFGFDPFIHHATEKLLSATGTISPKPLLYVGHYSLVVWMSRITNLSISFIDTLLVPVIAAIALPSTIIHTLKSKFNFSDHASHAAVLVIPLLLIPFYFSVPQNFANLLLLLTVILSLSVPARLGSVVVLWMLGIATCMIHPFSGILLLIYLFFMSLIIYFDQRRTPAAYRYLFIIPLAICSALALPTALSIGSWSSLPSIQEVSTFTFDSIFHTPLFDWVPFYSIYHLVYQFAHNHILLVVIALLLSTWLLYKTEHKKILAPLYITLAVAVVDIGILSVINLPIISYERPEFIARFWNIALLFGAPIIFYGAARLVSAIRAINNQKHRLPAIMFAATFFIALFITLSAYLLYPRVDLFAKSRGYSTSQEDIAAAQWIEQDAHGSDYVVLSNQAVAAAALRESGFKKYYKSNPSYNTLGAASLDLFYYPIPTTSPLYQLYLDMVYIAPTQKRLSEALDITGADVAYFVINDYWLDFDKRVAQAKEEFETYHVIGNNDIYIFKLSTENTIKH